MPVRHPAGVWLTLALIAAPAALAGSGLGLFIGLTALVAAAHRPTHDRVIETAHWAVSGGVLRAGLITLGAALIFQLVGLELAVLIAGDVLAYVELLAAVSLMAANARFKAIKARVQSFGVRVPIRVLYRRGRRAVRTTLIRLRTPPPDDYEPAWAV